MNGARRTVRVLICGERLRGDDAAAILAAEALPADARALAELVEVGQLDVESLLDVPNGAAVIVADAATGIPAGEVVTMPLDRIARRRGTGTAAPASSHALPPDQVLALATELRGSALHGSFVGIGGWSFGFGEELSPALAAALPAFVEALATEIRRLATGAGAEP